MRFLNKKLIRFLKGHFIYLKIMNVSRLKIIPPFSGQDGNDTIEGAKNKYPNDTLPVGSFATEAAREIVPSRVFGHVGQHHSLIFVPNYSDT